MPNIGKVSEAVEAHVSQPPCVALSTHLHPVSLNHTQTFSSCMQEQPLDLKHSTQILSGHSGRPKPCSTSPYGQS